MLYGTSKILAIYTDLFIVLMEILLNLEEQKKSLKR